uniref:Secreted protein n=1 Tax=Arundo donax TaxID=35708 RepID=A0A0A9BGB1_ARUDO
MILSSLCCMSTVLLYADHTIQQGRTGKAYACTATNNTRPLGSHGKAGKKNEKNKWNTKHTGGRTCTSVETPTI